VPRTYSVKLLYKQRASVDSNECLSFTNLWSLLLYIPSLLHYIGNAQENKKNTILSYNIAENSKRIKRNEMICFLA
jgi:hypothetical protein